MKCLQAYLFSLFLLLNMQSGYAAERLQGKDSLQCCDLIFVTSPRANAITDVTSGFSNLPFDHVAIYYEANGCPRIIESVPDGGVQMKDLQQFVSENNEAHAYVARVTADYDAARTLRNAFLYVGRPYDHLFLADNDAIYCSELVQFSFVDKQGTLVFPPIPMSFHDSKGKITEYWIRFYKEHGMEVPEGLPGTNPGELSRRNNVTVVFQLF